MRPVRTVVAGAVLAAGAGTRLGRPKADLVLDGHRLLDRACAVLTEAGCDPVLAVVRPGTAVTGARRIVNPEPDRGMRSSLALAVAAADGTDGTDALVVLLVDLPGLTAAMVRVTVAAWRPGRIAVAQVDGRRGHPLVMSPALWHRALDLAGPDEGARALLASTPSLVDVVELPGVATDLDDIDTPEDLARWRS